MSTAPLEDRLREAGGRLGFAQVGIARARPSDHVAFLQSWLERGYHGEMRYLAREDAVARRADLSRTLEGVRSVIVVADHYPAEDPRGVPDDPSVGVIARYARGRDYHQVLSERLQRLARWLEEALVAEGPVRGEVQQRVYVDTGPVLERELATRAGLGWFGRNTMLIHPRRGSYFLLGVLLTTAELDPDPPFEADHCGSCAACLGACPTGALLGRDESGAPVMDARRCISYLTIEHRGAIPEELRPLMGNRVFGCDICQEACPHSRKFGPSVPSHPAYASRGPGELPPGVSSEPADTWHPGTDFPSLIELMSMDEATWRSFSRGSPLTRPKRAAFLRNVAVALGNWGSPEAVPALSEALLDPSPLVRGHSAWALGQIASPDAFVALEKALTRELDDSVREELERALQRGSTSK